MVTGFNSARMVKTSRNINVTTLITVVIIPIMLLITSYNTFHHNYN